MNNIDNWYKNIVNTIGSQSISEENKKRVLAKLKTSSQDYNERMKAKDKKPVFAKEKGQQESSGHGKLRKILKDIFELQAERSLRDGETEAGSAIGDETLAIGNDFKDDPVGAMRTYLTGMTLDLPNLIKSIREKNEEYQVLHPHGARAANIASLLPAGMGVAELTGLVPKLAKSALAKSIIDGAILQGVSGAVKGHVDPNSTALREGGKETLKGALFGLGAHGITSLARGIAQGGIPGLTKRRIAKNIPEKLVDESIAMQKAAHPESKAVYSIPSMAEDKTERYIAELFSNPDAKDLLKPSLKNLTGNQVKILNRSLEKHANVPLDAEGVKIRLHKEQLKKSNPLYEKFGKGKEIEVPERISNTDFFQDESNKALKKVNRTKPVGEKVGRYHPEVLNETKKKMDESILSAKSKNDPTSDLVEIKNELSELLKESSEYKKASDIYSKRYKISEAIDAGEDLFNSPLENIEKALEQLNARQKVGVKIGYGSAFKKAIDKTASAGVSPNAAGRFANPQMAKKIESILGSEVVKEGQDLYNAISKLKKYTTGGQVKTIVESQPTTALQEIAKFTFSPLRWAKRTAVKAIGVPSSVINRKLNAKIAETILDSDKIMQAIQQVKKWKTHGDLDKLIYSTVQASQKYREPSDEEKYRMKARRLNKLLNI
jgi:hypothetical protein